MARLAYLGPPGTFAGEAIATQPDLSEMELLAKRTVPDVVNAVESGQADLGVIPLENSVEGSVPVTLDTLAFDTELLVQREIDLSITLQLCVYPGTKLAEITTVSSHPHGNAQCRLWLAAKLPDVMVEAANSTADAARLIAEAGPGSGKAANCNAAAAPLYGLEVIESDIQDQEGNFTRFVVLGRGIPGPTGHDKTAIVCFQREDRPGSLLAILSEFAARSINLTKLESRPTKQALGQYCFVLEFEGHVAEELVADCLRDVAARQAEVKFLGSYPVAGAEVANDRRKAADQAGIAASKWIDGLRAGIRPTDSLLPATDSAGPEDTA
ncbi:MAG: prephenate dehydratase [Actinomycetia bacterium]|nr:prephenate dehydratase [Actinomycetes bacterium]